MVKDSSNSLLCWFVLNQRYHDLCLSLEFCVGAASLIDVLIALLPRAISFFLRAKQKVGSRARAMRVIQRYVIV